MNSQNSNTNAAYQKLHVLLVDDDEFLLELMKVTLRDLGVGSVALAHNGFEGLNAYRQNSQRPNLIICDLCMPQLGGMELLSHLALDGCQSDILIISGHNLVPPVDNHWSLSNYNGPILNLAEKIARIQGLKVHASFEKPITREKIIEMLDVVIAQNSPRLQSDN
ncbi:response regulator [Undibacterium fentianense]|uniref:Response regulator n=1 Tax=Undibacterium fentianense TaxID=2828728 RepID=A0A941E1Z0_9BURK|nr:response regulator [Undibacterium fentianense]MBR7799587.1 response regulator [Undibacterium fentianense]